MQHSPRSPQLGTTTDHLGKTHSNVLSSHRTPTWALSNHLEWHHRSLHLVLEVICESRGLSNLTPSRSRLFKLIGRVKGMMWSCSKRLAYIVANIHKWEREEEAKARSMDYDQEVILEQPTIKHNTRPCSLPGLRWKENTVSCYAWS